MQVSEAVRRLEQHLTRVREPAREAYYIITELLADVGETGPLVTEIPDALFRKAVKIAKRRTKGEPVQYIFRRAYFLDMTLTIERGVFIPRPETEILVLLAREAHPPDSEIRIWDIGTGTGCIAIGLARHYPKARITASDINRKALRVARENARRYRVSDRIKFVRARGTIAADGLYDLVVSNPPYIRTEEMRGLDPEVLSEPTEALWGGDDGSALSREMILDPHLAPGGWLLFETSPFIAEAVLRLARSSGYEAEIFPDLSGFPRVIKARWSG